MRQETDQFIVDQLDVPVGEAAEKLNHHLTHEVPDGYQLVGLDHTDSVDDQTWFLLWAKLVATPDLHATQAMVLQQEELLARRDEQISQHVMEKAELAAKLDEARDIGLSSLEALSEAFTLTIVVTLGVPIVATLAVAICYFLGCFVRVRGIRQCLGHQPIALSDDLVAADTDLTTVTVGRYAYHISRIYFDQDGTLAPGACIRIRASVQSLRARTVTVVVHILTGYDDFLTDAVVDMAACVDLALQDVCTWVTRRRVIVRLYALISQELTISTDRQSLMLQEAI
jgi:hypothetical protein